MERLTDKKEADAQRIEYENRLKSGYPRNIPEERFLKLAAYENTGLEPEEVSEYQRLCDSYAKAGLDAKFVQFCIDATQNGLSMDRIRELARAEKDGRLVMLQGGVTVHYLQEEYRKAKCMADERLPSPDYTTGRISGFGAGVIYILDKILTQEEAEAAQEKMKEVDNEAD